MFKPVTTLNQILVEFEIRCVDEASVVKLYPTEEAVLRVVLVVSFVRVHSLKFVVSYDQFFALDERAFWIVVKDDSGVPPDVVQAAGYVNSRTTSTKRTVN